MSRIVRLGDLSGPASVTQEIYRSHSLEPTTLRSAQGKASRCVIRFHEIPVWWALWGAVAFGVTTKAGAPNSARDPRTW